MLTSLLRTGLGRQGEWRAFACAPCKVCELCGWLMGVEKQEDR